MGARSRSSGHTSLHSTRFSSCVSTPTSSAATAATSSSRSARRRCGCFRRRPWRRTSTAITSRRIATTRRGALSIGVRSAGRRRWTSAGAWRAEQLLRAANADYSLNPGEAFAESYRVLVESTGTAAGDRWPIVDASFRPDVAALAALRADVLDPWTGPAVTAVRGRFKGSARYWTATLATPLDGDLSIKVGASDDLSLRSGDGRTVLARSAWTSTGGKFAAYRVCGTRSLQVRVSRLRAAASFTLRISRP